MKQLLAQKYITILSFLGIGIIVLLSHFSYVQIKQFSAANQLMIRTFKVIEASDNSLILINHMESRQRGYLLTNDPTYLIRYNALKMKLLANVNVLKYLTQDNPYQQTRIHQFEEKLALRIQLLNSVIAMNQQRGQKAAVDLMLKNKGQVLLDELRQLAADITIHEKMLLGERIALVHQHAKNVTKFVVLGSIIGLSLILFCIFLLNEQLRQRTDIERRLRKSEKELLSLAYYDALTGLPNRILISKTIEKMVASRDTSTFLSILLIDIDGFKNINESLGTETGDRLLQAFANRLSEQLGANDIIARLGSDEFIVVLTSAQNVDDTASIANKIVNAMIKPIAVNEKMLLLTISVGVSIFPTNGTTAKALMKQADIAMHKAKELGKNNYQFSTPEMASAAEERAMLDYYLRQALAKNEFRLLYQPKFSLKENKISGVEALIRWQHPQDGLISPDEFIDIAEANGMIVPIGEWVVREACLQGKKWLTQGLPIKNIAINVSSRQFLSNDIVAYIKGTLLETGFDPTHMELEITENLLLEDSLNNIKTLQELQKIGIKITIDDFGTGFSALSYLTLFPIDKLKIDKSFIQKINSRSQEHSIIIAIIVMAHSLGINVVAEGVENKTQLNFLFDHACDEVQGFYVSVPLTAEEFENFMTQRTEN